MPAGCAATWKPCRIPPISLGQPLGYARHHAGRLGPAFGKSCAVTTGHSALDRSAAATQRAFARPRLIAVLCVVALAGAGWLYLGLMVAGMARSGGLSALGPGMAIFDLLGRPDGLGRALIAALCRPSFAAGASASTMAELSLTLAMWCAMALAMMLPTAGPMIVTYAQIAETAAAKGERVVSPPVLAAGYITVWLGFAVLASLLQWALSRAALLDPALVPVSGLLSGAVLLGAGAYQFSALKHA